MDVKKRINELSEILLDHQYSYYVLSRPNISDREYDRLYDELVSLEKKYPQYALDNSPTKRIGSDLDNTFPEKDHTIPVLSLDKEYSTEGISKWIKKLEGNIKSPIEFIVEEKLDGVSIVLYYKKGRLDTALTRGNGFAGNDVTVNIRTIREIPLILKKDIDLVVRGEIFIRKDDFNKFNALFDNKYSNPRNLAAGSLRNIKSSVTAKVPLMLFAYEGHFQQDLNHIESLGELKRLNFTIDENFGFFSENSSSIGKLEKTFPGSISGPVSQIPNYIEKKRAERDSLKYEIDGLVVKVNRSDLKKSLGMTAHHPRWAIAFKFESPLETTILTDIVIQIGRNGRVTPVAILQPVKIAGSIVSRATLHNQEYIDILELGIGDMVTISKRGDVIPAVDSVVEKNEDKPTIYSIPPFCPFCRSELVKDGSHHFCKNKECPERKRRRLVFFVSKDQMDIDSLGEKTISFLFEKGFIKSIPDIYTFNYDLLLDEEGFKEKKIANIRQSLEKSKNMPFERVVSSLGFDGISTFAAKELVCNEFDSFDKIIKAALDGKREVFSGLRGFGDITADQIIKHFSDNENIQLIRKLEDIGLNTSRGKDTHDEHLQIFVGQTWVITGSFKNFLPRSKAVLEIENRGGKVSTSISSKTTYLLAGTSSGSKLAKAKNLGVKIVDEKEFIEMLKQG